MISKNSKIYIAGHNGMVGSAILRILKDKGYKNLIYKNSNKLDLRDQDSTYKFLKKKKTRRSLYCISKSWRNFSKPKK